MFHLKQITKNEPMLCDEGKGSQLGSIIAEILLALSLPCFLCTPQQLAKREHLMMKADE